MEIAEPYYKRKMVYNMYSLYFTPPRSWEYSYFSSLKRVAIAFLFILIFIVR